MVSKPFTKSAMGECSGMPNLLSKRNGKITKNDVEMERGINNIKCTNKKFFSDDFFNLGKAKFY